MIRLVVSLFDRGHNHAAAIYTCSIYIKQNAWNNVFRSYIAEHVGCLLHFGIRQRVKFPALVIDANHNLTSAKVTHGNQFAASVVFVQDAFLELHLAHFATVSEL